MYGPYCVHIWHLCVLWLPFVPIPLIFMMHAWQKQSKYQPQFLLNFQNWFLKVLCIQQIKNQTLSADFPILQTHLFLHVMIRWVMRTICFDFANAHHVIVGKIFCKTAWYTQMPYMDTIRAVHYNLSVPYVSPQHVSFTPSIVTCWSLKWMGNLYFS